MSPSTEAGTMRNTRLATQLLEAMDRQQFDVVERMLSPDFHLYFSGQKLNSAETVAMVRSVYEAFADLRHDVEETLAVDNRVVLRMTLRGTHTGTFEGTPASGRTIAVGQISIFRVADDRITEIREEADLLVLMQQIEAIPAA